MALFSLEMSETELAHRFIASQAKVSSDELRKGRVRGDRWPKVLKRWRSWPALRSSSMTRATSACWRCGPRPVACHSRQGGLGLIVVDYLQLVRADGRSDSRVEQVGAISRGLKILAASSRSP